MPSSIYSLFPMGVTVSLLCAGRGTWDIEVKGPGVLWHAGAFSKVNVRNTSFLGKRKASNRFTENMRTFKDWLGFNSLREEAYE